MQRLLTKQGPAQISPNRCFKARVRSRTTVSGASCRRLRPTAASCSGVAKLHGWFSRHADDRQTAAAAALTRLHERAGASGTPWGLGLLTRARALLADDSRAESLYLESLKHLRRAGVATEWARSSLVFGEWLRRQRRRRDARVQLRSALLRGDRGRGISAAGGGRAAGDRGARPFARVLREDPAHAASVGRGPEGQILPTSGCGGAKVNSASRIRTDSRTAPSRRTLESTRPTRIR